MKYSICIIIQRLVEAEERKYLLKYSICLSFSVNDTIPVHWVQGVPSSYTWQWLEKVITVWRAKKASNTCDKLTQNEKKIKKKNLTWIFLENCEITNLDRMKILCQYYYCRVKYKMLNSESTAYPCTSIAHTNCL